MRLATLAFLFLFGFLPVLTGCAGEPRSGKGWVEFYPIATSPDHAFLRDFAEDRVDYQISQEYRWWEIDDLLVGYWDLNDDGVEEMFLSYAKAGTSYHCGNSFCPMYLFQKRDVLWHEVHDRPRGAVYVSDEKIGGYRTLYDSEGTRFRWSGMEYAWDCPEDAPVEVRDDRTSTCFREDRWLRLINEPRESWPP